MIRLIKGDINKLEGKVIAFARVGSEIGDEKIMALYAATNPLDFAEKIGAPEEIANYLKKQDEENTRRSLEEIAKQGVDISNLHIVPYYLMVLPISDEADTLLGDEDVLDVGSMNNPGASFEYLRKIISAYFIKYEDSVSQKHGLGKRNLGENNAEEKPKVTYKDIRKEDFRRFITESYIVPILDAYRYGNEADANLAGAEFIRFGSGASFSSSIVDMVDSIKNNKNTPNIVMLENYLNMIVALNEEDYHTAARARDKIRELNG